jgi:hypothetical protein
MGVYVNAASQAMSPNTNDLAGTIVSTAALIWGAMSSALQFPFTGLSCQLALYNKALSAGEVAATWAGGNGFPDLNAVGPVSDLYGWWPVGFADDATVIQDATANNRDGTPTNMSSSDFAPIYHHELRAA